MIVEQLSPFEFGIFLNAVEFEKLLHLLYCFSDSFDTGVKDNMKDFAVALIKKLEDN